MSSLHELGFTAECPTEVLLSTFSPKGDPHASTVGVRINESGELEMKIYTSTKTFQNIVKTGAAVINISRDPKLLASQALKEIPNLKMPLRFEKSQYVNAPRFSDADAYVELEVKKINKVEIFDDIGASELAYVAGVVKNIEIMKRSVPLFRRADFFLLESAILATRAIEALKRGKSDLAGKMIQEIESYREKCSRIAPRSPEMEMITRITDFLKKWLGRSWRE